MGSSNVGLVAGQARTLVAALEPRIGIRNPPDERMLCWVVEFAAYLMNMCDIGSDGKKPLHRLHGRKDKLGEKILCVPAKPARGGKWKPRFHPGVFVGMLKSSLEAVVVTNGWRSRHAQRTSGIPKSGRWDADRMLGTRTVPWCPDGSDNAFDMHVGTERPAEMVPRSFREVLMENKVARTDLRRAEFERWGFSEGCPLLENWRQQDHSEACRRMIEALLRGDSSGSAQLAAAYERISGAQADAVE